MLHKYAEEHYTNKESKNISNLVENLSFDEKAKLKTSLPILIKQFHNFYQQHKHLVCIKNEFQVGDLEDTKICGTLDMLVLNEQTNELEILDFKTNKRMQLQSKYGNFFHPFDKMPECEITEYTIQLNLYKYFIEKYTSLKVSRLKLIWINALNENYQIFDLQTTTPLIEEMLKRVKLNALFQEEVIES